MFFTDIFLLSYVDRVEFSEAVKGSRMAELSLNVLIEVRIVF